MGCLKHVLRLLASLKFWNYQLAVCQNLVPLVNIKIAGKWMFIPLKMVLIGIDPYPIDGSSVNFALRLWLWASTMERIRLGRGQSFV